VTGQESVRILLINQFFYPDSAATSQLLTDVARDFAADGHSVRAICGRSSYAETRSVNPPAVDIVRTPDLAFGRGLAARVLSYASFLTGALYHSLIGPRPDIVLTLTTPPGLSIIGSILKTIYHARHFIWEMDLYPDIAVDLKVLHPRSWVTRTMGAAFDTFRRRADGVIAVGESMRTRLIRRGIPAANIHTAENWADGCQIYPLPFPDPKPLRISYSGNLGLAHDLETIRAAITHFRSDSRFHFAFAGAGPLRDTFESFCREHDVANVSFAGYRSYGDLAQSLGACHVGLVTQKLATLGAVVPSKTYGLMAAGRPILFIGPREGIPARIIERFRCGWQIDPGDTRGLIELLEFLTVNLGAIHDAGARARDAFLQHYDLPIGVARIRSILGVPHVEPVATAGSGPLSRPNSTSEEHALTFLPEVGSLS
jgi:glycosyltransferase involved in cell wall biosynthesis